MIVLWEGNSGLCNRLFISAYGIALAKATGQKLVNIHLDRYENLFPATRPKIGLPALRYPVYRGLRILIKVLRRMPFARKYFVGFAGDGSNSAYYCPTNEKFISELKGGAVRFVYGWPYLEKMRFTCADHIRDSLAPPPEVLEKARKDAELARRGADVLVGVHRRAGDLRVCLRGKHYFEPEQYRAVMERMTKLFAPKRVAFLLCSDEPLI